MLSESAAVTATAAKRLRSNVIEVAPSLLLRELFRMTGEEAAHYLEPKPKLPDLGLERRQEAA
jgi:hypothetical protein